jgi:hypothetical protein
MKPIFSLFPKFYREYTPQQLAELVRHTGLDTVNLVVARRLLVRAGHGTARRTTFRGRNARMRHHGAFCDNRFARDPILCSSRRF